MSRGVGPTRKGGSAGGSGSSLSNATPLAPSGVGTPGTSLEASRADHVHPATAGGSGPELSDDAPAALGAASAGVGTKASRHDHVHATPSAVDVGADASGSAAAAQSAAEATAAAALTAHEEAADPHPLYALEADVAVLDADDIAETATRVWVSPAQEAKLDAIEAGATANATDAALRDRATHTGTQLASTISDHAAAALALVTAAPASYRTELEVEAVGARTYDRAYTHTVEAGTTESQWWTIYAPIRITGLVTRPRKAALTSASDGATIAMVQVGSPDVDIAAAQSVLGAKDSTATHTVTPLDLDPGDEVRFDLAIGADVVGEDLDIIALYVER